MTGALYVKQITVRFQVLTFVRIKVDVFWVVAQCSLAKIYHLAMMTEAASMSNISKLLPDHTAQQPRGQPSSKDIMFCQHLFVSSLCIWPKITSWKVKTVSFTGSCNSSARFMFGLVLIYS
jgi:hypothetical protein